MKLKCGVKYKVGVGAPPPRHAKFAVYFWGFVIYHTCKSAVDSTIGSLTYYEAEDAQIVNLRKDRTCRKDQQSAPPSRRR